MKISHLTCYNLNMPLTMAKDMLDSLKMQIKPTKPVKLLENIPVQPESTASEKLSAASEKETGAQQEPQAQPKQDTEQPQQ